MTNEFGYNGRSELASALMGTNVYGYSYDLIGNRQFATNNAESLAYLANALNQYTNIADGASIAPTYDLDGNVLAYGDWAFAWDGQNRLAAAWSNSTLVVSNAYDYMSRRVAKVAGVATRRFLYDGWAMVRELTTDNGSPVTNSYVYGLDLSGSLQGAGTIGGILSMLSGPSPVVSFYCYDANGNVTELVSANGSTAAKYGYDPFGNTVLADDTDSSGLVSANPFRFSSKYTDDETGLLYYGYRYYSPTLGRWVSRDPLQEIGGFNLYGMLCNDPVQKRDILGTVDQTVWDLIDLLPPGPILAPIIAQIILPTALDLEDSGTLGFFQGAWNWAFGNGATQHLSFASYDPGWKPGDFNGYENLVAQLCQQCGRSERVALYRVRDLYAEGLNTVMRMGGPGRYTVLLNGWLSSTPASGGLGCWWSFSGRVTIASEMFDFDPENGGRPVEGQAITVIVALLRNALGVGNDFMMVFDGGRDVKDEGFCCGLGLAK